MRPSILLMVVVGVGAGCLLPAEASPQESPRHASAVAAALSGIIDELFGAWEPQRMSQEEAIALGTRHYTRSPDFSMVIDATYYPTPQDWAAKRAQLIVQHRQTLREARHETTVERIVFLGSDAAALTRSYRFSFTAANGRRGHQDSAITCLFRREGGTWRIVQYHSSHGPEVYLDAPNEG